jgi:hypothetical protein
VSRTVRGIFDRPGDAEKLKDELIQAGVARHRILISRLAAEDNGDEPIVGKVADPCVVSVVVRSPVDKQHVAQLMLRYGGRVRPRV